MRRATHSTLRQKEKHKKENHRKGRVTRSRDHGKKGRESNMLKTHQTIHGTSMAKERSDHHTR